MTMVFDVPIEYGQGRKTRAFGGVAPSGRRGDPREGRWERVILYHSSYLTYSTVPDGPSIYPPTEIYW